jgi:hypothetical protein
LPIARASADVVATTSLVEGLMKTLHIPANQGFPTDPTRIDEFRTGFELRHVG